MSTNAQTPVISREAYNAGVIEVRVHRVEELFNTLDPTPFPEKDLDDAAEEFIVSWARELHKRTPLIVRVQVSGPPEEQRSIERVRETIRTYFAHRAEISRLKFGSLMSRGRVSLLVGLLFLATCMFLANIVSSLGTGPLFVVMREGLMIGGWVAMWRPLEIFLYDWWPMLAERRLFERLSNATVEVVSAAARPETHQTPDVRTASGSL